MPGSGKSVLVIEDHEDSCSVLKQMLRRRGFHAECASTLGEAESCLNFAEAQGRPYHCVVSDLGLGDSNAEQTVAWLKKISHRLPVRAISGLTDPEVIEACRTARIPLILKGTSAEGIMESVLYALTERDTKPDREIMHMIADNRKDQRELHAVESHGWGKAGKIVLKAGAFIGTVLAAGTLGATLFHSLEERILDAARTKSQFEFIDKKLLDAGVERKENAQKIRVLEDTRIETNGKLAAINEKLDRIERKLEGGSNGGSNGNK